MTRPLKNLCEVAVIGGGLAGLCAAREAARLGRLVTLFEGSGLYGGMVATLGEVADLPFPGEPSGQDLAMALLAGARRVGVRVIEAEVAGLEVGAQLTLTDSNGGVHHPGAVIVASGITRRRLGVPGEAELTGAGVSSCATCDGGFYRGRDVAVVGGGDGAVHEALVLSRVAARVFMVCRSPLRAKREHIDLLVARENVHYVWDSEVCGVLGTSKVSGVALRNRRSGADTVLEVAGVFPFVGGDAATGFVPAALLDGAGCVITDAGLGAADPRIFAAGACRAGYGGAGVQAMAEGVGAAAAAHRRLGV